VNYPFVLSKALWEEVGGLDERFNPGPANDPDLFYRLVFANAELIRAEDAIAYHFSGKSSRMADEARQERREWQVVTARNERRFVEKWGEEYRYVNGGLPSPGPEALRRWTDSTTGKTKPIEVQSSLRVVMDACCIGSRAEGIGTYARNLIRALARLPDPPRLHCRVTDRAEAMKTIGSEGNISIEEACVLLESGPSDGEGVSSVTGSFGAALTHGLSFASLRDLVSRK